MDAWYRLDEEGILEDRLIDTMWKDIWDKEPSKKDAVVSNIDILFFKVSCEFYETHEDNPININNCNKNKKTTIIINSKHFTK